MNRNIGLAIKLCISLAAILGIALIRKINTGINQSTTKNMPKPSDNLAREKLFEESEIFTTKFNDLEEKKIDEDLKQLIRPKLEELFLKRNLNIQELKGKIYYEIKGSSIEVLVLWKSSIYENEYSNYDRLELIL